MREITLELQGIIKRRSIEFDIILFGVRPSETIEVTMEYDLPKLLISK